MASVHPDDRDRVRKAMRTSLETGRDYEVEYRNVWPDGSLHWAEIRARIVHDRRGGQPRLVGVSSDISERKFAEDKLKRLNESLEERVVERTAELKQAHEAILAEIEQRQRAEDQLRQAQKLEIVGQITGGVAHDFNNLLMAVIANLELLRKRVPGDHGIDRLIEGALQGAQRGAVLTQRLLAFARRQDLQPEPHNLVDLVRGMSDLIERSIGSGIELRLDLPAELPLALLDANQIELALLNLLINARDAMPEGGVLSVKVDDAVVGEGGDLAAGRYVRLVVSDSGYGMDAETLKRATEPFFSTKEVGKGTGLGLSMIQGLVSQLKGSLRLTSVVGLGTTSRNMAAGDAPSCPRVPGRRPAPTIIFARRDDPCCRR